MFFTISFGYFMLLQSLSELVGIVPFSGGNFGFVRCALGPFWGYLAACMEFLYYCMYNARALSKISLLVDAAGEFDTQWQPLWAFLAMVFVVLVNIRGGLTFWTFMMSATLFTLSILMIFYVGAYSHIDFKGYALGHNYSEQYQNDGFIGDSSRYLFYVVRITTFYLGLDVLPLCSLRVVNESKVIPRVMLASYGIIFCISFLALIGVACHYPGIHPSLGKTLFVLQYGMEDAVKLNPKLYPLLLLLPTVASATGYLYAAGNQLAAMSESGLVPGFLKPRFGNDQIPMISIVVCGVMQFIVYFFINYYEPELTVFAAHVWSIAAPGLFTFVCLAFIAFRVKFSTMKRNYVNPFGIPGATYGALCWLFVAVVNSHHRFQPHTKPIKTFYIFMSIMIVYYFVYVRHVQCFSKEEQDKFMKAYILNANRMRTKSTLYKPMASEWYRSAKLTLRRLHTRSYSSSISSGKEISLDSLVSTGIVSYDAPRPDTSVEEETFPMETIEMVAQLQFGHPMPHATHPTHPPLPQKEGEFYNIEDNKDQWQEDEACV
jgi:ethanolamine permease